LLKRKRVDTAWNQIAQVSDPFTIALSNNVVAMQNLFMRGLPVHITDKEGASLLHYAASASLEMVRFLIDKGLNVNAQDAKGLTVCVIANFNVHLASSRCSEIK